MPWVEAHPRVLAAQAVRNLFLEHHAQRHCVAFLAEQRAAAAAGEARRLLGTEHELRDGRLGRERIQRLEPSLHVDEQGAETIGLRPAQWRVPSTAGCGVMPRSDRSRAARRLPVWSQRS